MQRVDYLIDYILKENPEIKVNKQPESPQEKFNLYRSLCNIRKARPISDEYIHVENKYLQDILKNKKCIHYEDIKTINQEYPTNNVKNGDKISLYQGDITTIEIDAIVNAANSQGLGCFIPCHNCIDNQINTYAGVSLRLECNEYMKKIDYNLPTGEAFITRGYNLPASYVIHTVGPAISDMVHEKQKEELSNCYKNCLAKAQEKRIRSIAFCSISTGVFRFPKDLASQIAIKTVDSYLEENYEHFDKIVFNVYSNGDKDIYERLFQKS
ncbi:MAG: protein-ADP-ribose hydrolase [Methanosphaera sp.]|nr:protein-ADP-ribose hydrolase [Methanosphaera sp.]